MKKGREAGWYFNPRKDSLCFGDGVRGLRWFMSEFPDEDVWGRVRYIDVDDDLRAFHTEKSFDVCISLERKRLRQCWTR
jgi:hypothetical protein